MIGAGAILSSQDYAKDDRFDADVVVVGTGAGGAVAGAELAAAGLRVLFVEEGSYIPTQSFNPYMSESIPRMYRDAGTTAVLGTPNIPYIEGRVLGGTTVINGGMAYRAPDHILDGWAAQSGDGSLGAARMDDVFREVEKNIASNYQSEASIGDDNRLMALGAQKLGWRSDVNRRNQSECVGSNNCIFGCPTGAKQSMLVSYLPRAIQAGARCLTELRVGSLIIEHGRCVGVKARTYDAATRRPGKEVTVRGKAVIIACGAVHTPFLLQKHRLGRPSRLLGKHLLLHPNAKVIAIYPFDTYSWKGVSQWTQVREFHNEGVLFAENMIPPSAMGASLPWHGRESLALLERYNQMVSTGVLVEDSTTGVVQRSIVGMPVARYDITDGDFDRFVRGVARLAELHFAMGAEQVLLPYRSHHIARSMEDVRAVTTTSVKKRDLELFTVHLMGTARMGGRAEASVVDLAGEMWDLPGCYVADASIFPTAIGVNPQVTIMALATRIARRLAESWSKVVVRARAARAA